ncbi:hypothetical protein BH11ARM2_BH11ARM2_03590 [soil metagenome]
MAHNAGILFTLGFFYHRMLGNAEAYDHVPSLRECVEGAAGADRLYAYGTGLFRLYEKTGG